MELVINNDSLIKRLKDIISLFWQPAMGGSNNNSINHSKRWLPNKPNNDDNETLYDLDRIELWNISSDTNTLYIIGCRQQNDKLVRITASNNKNLNNLINEALNKGLSVSEKPIREVMDSLSKEIYIREYYQNHYNNCKRILYVLEKEMNSIYQPKEEARIKSRRL